MVVERSKLEALYERHAPELLQFLQRRTHDAGDAEDLLQETFVEAARFEDRLRDAASPRAWLFGVARNVAGNLGRRVRRLRSRPLPDDLPAPAAADEDPRIESVRRKITRLPAHLRETLELRLAADLSYAEIAEALGLPIGTVRSRLNQAAHRLTEMLRETNEDDET